MKARAARKICIRWPFLMFSLAAALLLSPRIGIAEVSIFKSPTPTSPLSPTSRYGCPRPIEEPTEAATFLLQIFPTSSLSEINAVFCNNLSFLGDLSFALRENATKVFIGAISNLFSQRLQFGLIAGKVPLGDAVDLVNAVLDPGNTTDLEIKQRMGVIKVAAAAAYAALPITTYSLTVPADASALYSLTVAHYDDSGKLTQSTVLSPLGGTFTLVYPVPSNNKSLAGTTISTDNPYFVLDPANPGFNAEGQPDTCTEGTENVLQTCTLRGPSGSDSYLTNPIDGTITSIPVILARFSPTSPNKPTLFPVVSPFGSWVSWRAFVNPISWWGRKISVPIPTTIKIQSAAGDQLGRFSLTPALVPITSSVKAQWCDGVGHCSELSDALPNNSDSGATEVPDIDPAKVKAGGAVGEGELVPVPGPDPFDPE